MCAEYRILVKPEEIAEKFEQEFYNLTSLKTFDEHVRLYGEAPVLLIKDHRPVIQSMRFSLKPPGTPYPTFNARLLSWDDKAKKIVHIYEKPTWKKPFAQQRALVPLSAFIEPVYTSEHAGKMMRFSEKHGSVLFCPALYDESIDKKTGEIYQGFALILTTPSDFVQKIGHHRQPLFLKPKEGLRWLQEGSLNYADGMDLLTHHAYQPELSVETERSMAKGWEKRIGESEHKLAKEKEFMKNLERLS